MKTHSASSARAIRLLTVLLFLLFAASYQALGQTTPSAILFKNVRIFDGNATVLTPPSFLLVKEDAIAQISATPIAAPDGYKTTVIEGGNRVLIPGLIDAHYHSMDTTYGGASREGDQNYRVLAASVVARAQLLRGFTTIRDLAGSSFGLKRAIDNGLVLGPRIYPSGALISQTSGHGDRRPPTDSNPRFGGNTPRTEINGDSFLADGRDQVLSAVREQLRQGASQIKLATSGGVSTDYDPIDVQQFTLDEIKAAVEAASDWGTYVTVHCYTPESARRSIEAGVKVIDHGQLLDEPTIRLMAEKGIWLSIQPFFASDQPGTMKGLEAAKFQTVVAGTDNAYKLAKKYHVKLAFGTDETGKIGNEENEKLVSLTRWFAASEILHMATAANGELLKLSGPRNPYPKMLGVIEPGAYADLLLVNGNPLDDIGILADPAKSLAVIVKNGAIVKNIVAE